MQHLMKFYKIIYVVIIAIFIVILIPRILNALYAFLSPKKSKSKKSDNFEFEVRKKIRELGGDLKALDNENTQKALPKKTIPNSVESYLIKIQKLKNELESSGAQNKVMKDKLKDIEEVELIFKNLQWGNGNEINLVLKEYNRSLKLDALNVDFASIVRMAMRNGYLSDERKFLSYPILEKLKNLVLSFHFLNLLLNVLIKEQMEDQLGENSSKLAKALSLSKLDMTYVSIIFFHYYLDISLERTLLYVVEHNQKTKVEYNTQVSSDLIFRIIYKNGPYTPQNYLVFYQQVQNIGRQINRLVAQRENTNKRPQFLEESYETLSVDFGATDKEIKRAYNKLVMKYHPDKLGDNATKETNRKFNLVQTAFENIKKHKGEFKDIVQSIERAFN